jgi:hypothetical protein
LAIKLAGGAEKAVDKALEAATKAQSSADRWKKAVL